MTSKLTNKRERYSLGAPVAAESRDRFQNKRRRKSSVDKRVSFGMVDVRIFQNDENADPWKTKKPPTRSPHILQRIENQPKLPTVTEESPPKSADNPLHPLKEKQNKNFVIDNEDSMSLMALIGDVENEDSPEMERPTELRDDTMEFTVPHGAILKQNSVEPKESILKDDTMEFTVNHGAILKSTQQHASEPKESIMKDDTMEFTVNHGAILKSTQQQTPKDQMDLSKPETNNESIMKDDSMEFTVPHGAILKQNLVEPKESILKDDTMEFTVNHGAILKSTQKHAYEPKESILKDDTMEFTVSHGTILKQNSVEPKESILKDDTMEFTVPHGAILKSTQPQTPKDQMREEIEAALVSSDRTVDLPKPESYSEVTQDIASIYRNILNTDATPTIPTPKEFPSTPTTHSHEEIVQLDNMEDCLDDLDFNLITPRASRHPKLDIRGVLAAVTPRLGHKLSLKDFLTCAGVRFFDEDSNQMLRRSSVGPMPPPPSGSVEELREYWIDSVELECLKKTTQDLVSEIDNLKCLANMEESKLNATNPAIFSQFRSASSDHANELQNKLKQLKNWSKIKSKSNWNELKKIQIDEVKDRLVGVKKFLQNDLFIMNAMLTELDSICNISRQLPSPQLINLRAGIEEQAQVITQLKSNQKELESRCNELKQKYDSCFSQNESLAKQAEQSTSLHKEYSHLWREVQDLQDEHSLMTIIISWKPIKLTSDQCVFVFMESFEFIVNLDGDSVISTNLNVLPTWNNAIMNKEIIESLINSTDIPECLKSCKSRKDLPRIYQTLEHRINRIVELVSELNTLQSEHRMLINCYIENGFPYAEIVITSHPDKVPAAQLVFTSKLEPLPENSNYNNSINFIIGTEAMKNMSKSVLTKDIPNFGRLEYCSLSLQGILDTC